MKPRKITERELIQRLVDIKLKQVEESADGIVWVTPMITIEANGRKYSIDGALVAKEAGLEPVPGRLNYWRKKGGENGD